MSSDVDTQSQAGSSNYRFLVGVFLAATGSVISNLGLNLQKLTHVQISNSANNAHGESPSTTSSASPQPASSSQPRSPYFMHPTWALGLVLVIVGSVADFAALGFAAQTIVAPLGAFTLVSNVFFAPYFSGESVSRYITPCDCQAV